MQFHQKAFMIVMRSGARQRLRCSSLTKKRIAQLQPSSLLHC
jgi:hypothetical protein